MYRIQAHNIRTKSIEIIKTHCMVEKMKILRDLKNNLDYGLVTVEFNPRGSFYR